MRAAVWDRCLERLGPEVFRIGWVAAKFKRDEMVLFVIPQAGIGVAVFADLFDFQMIRVARFRTNGFRAPSRVADRLANIFLSYLWIDCPRSPRRVRINVRRTNASGNSFASLLQFRVRRRMLCSDDPRNDKKHDDDYENMKNTFSILHPLQCNSRAMWFL